MNQFLAIICSILLSFPMTGCGSSESNQLPIEPSTSLETVSTESSANIHSQTETSTETQTPSSESQPSSEQITAPQESQIPPLESGDHTMPEDNTVTKMNVQIGDSTFTATLESNSAVDSLVEMIQDAPVVIGMSDYSGFEKVGSLGTTLPASNSQTTTQAGDIVLYNGNQIVIFYGSNSWSYTRLGRIDDLLGWEEALGNGDVTVTFSVD